MGFTPTKSVKACPMCKGHLWECCSIGLNIIDVEQDGHGVSSIVDDIGISEPYNIDFCVKCGCGVTSHNFSKEETTDG